MATHLDRGSFGEQGAGFFLGAQGYFFVDGPSGDGGHAANAGGFDGLAYNIVTDDLIILDNKAYKSSGNVRSGTAIDPVVNLAQNLDVMIAQVDTMTDMPAQTRIASQLRATRAAITSTGIKPPPNVRIAISNFGGNSKGVTDAFAARGIVFIDMKNTPPLPSTRIYLTKDKVLGMAKPVTNDVDAFEGRRERAAALAEAARVGAQWLNDISLDSAIDGKLEELVPQINDAIVRGGGALVVVNVESREPIGNLNVVTTRSLNSAYVVAHPNKNESEAVKAFRLRSAFRMVMQPGQSIETRLRWVATPGVK